MAVQPGPVARLRPALKARRSALQQAVVVLALTLTLWVSRWHGLDYPAQLYRVGLVRRQGLGVWDANWYGGHYTPAYGVVVPWLASVVGLSAIAMSVDAGLGRDLRAAARQRQAAARGDRDGSLRVPDARQHVRRQAAVRLRRAVRLADRCLGASGAMVVGGRDDVADDPGEPVAGAFLALTFAAWALSLPRQNWHDLVRSPQMRLAGGSLTIIATISLIFHEGGMFPDNIGDMVIAVGTGALVWWVLLPGSYLAIRWAFGLAGLLALPLLLLPNPMGGNLSRLAVVGAPLLFALPRRRNALHVVVCLVLLGWQAAPLLRLPEAAEDPSAKAAYFEPLISELKGRHEGPVRLEIPLTESHWEAADVARGFPWPGAGSASSTCATTASSTSPR